MCCDGMLFDADGDRSESSICDRADACPARTTGRTPPRPTPRCRALGVAARDDRRRRCASFPACRTARSGSRRSAASVSSTTARRPTPTPPQGAGLLRRDLLDRRRPAEGGRHRRRWRRSSPRIRHAFLIGEATGAVRRDARRARRAVHALRRRWTPPSPPRTRRARRDGAGGAVVLLSPACASFDQFTDFEHAAMRFRALVARACRARSLGRAA